MTAVRVVQAEMSVAGRAYWALSRMVNHGWSVLDFGLGSGGWLVLGTPTGLELPVAADPIDHIASSPRTTTDAPPLLTLHACRLLGRCATGRSEAYAAATADLIGALLRLRLPAGRAHTDDARTPWCLPHLRGTQPAASVRRAYWTATTLTDDYGWRITGLDSRGFAAVGPYDTEQVYYRRGDALAPRTSTRLVELLVDVADDGGIGELQRLILAHQRTSRAIVRTVRGHE